MTAARHTWESTTISLLVFSLPSKPFWISGALGTKSAPTACLRLPGKGRVTRESAMALAMAARTGSSMLVPMMPSPSLPLSFGGAPPFGAAEEEAEGTNEGASADICVLFAGAEADADADADADAGLGALDEGPDELVMVGWSAARRF